MCLAKATAIGSAICVLRLAGAVQAATIAQWNFDAFGSGTNVDKNGEAVNNSTVAAALGDFGLVFNQNESSSTNIPFGTFTPPGNASISMDKTNNGRFRMPRA